MSTVTKTQAEAVLEAVKAQFAEYLEPLVIGEHTYDGWPEPVLLEDHDGAPYAVLWEEGPDGWIFSLDGSPTEEEHVLMAQASEEFGVTLTAKAKPAAKMPAGVFVEPMNSCVLGVYPA